MAYLFPRFAVAPVRCAPIRHEIAPLWSLFDDATRHLQQVERQVRRSKFNPRFDVKEDKESYILEGEVPGFKDNELSIEWNDNVLAIRGRHVSVTESGDKPQAVEATPEKAALENSTSSETGSVKSQKSHQATVEDEEPANASAVAAEGSESTTPQPTEQTPAKVESNPEPQQPQSQKWISERTTGEFLRQFSFPSKAINHDAIKASLESGILKIVVPKAAVPESRRINIE